MQTSDFAQLYCAVLLFITISHVIWLELVDLFLTIILSSDIIQKLIYGIKGILLILSVLELCVCTATVVFSCKAKAFGTKMVRFPEG